MVSLQQLLDEVESAFAATAHKLSPWPDPHGADGPAEEAYSRVTNGGKYQLFGARADAWVAALQTLELATVDRQAPPIRWRSDRRKQPERAFVISPVAPGAITFHLGLSPLDGVANSALHLAVGEPPTAILHRPECGCDACDIGSDYVIEEIDDLIESVVTGTFRLLHSGNNAIIECGGSGWSSRGEHDVHKVLRDPTGSGYTVIEGTSWLDG